MELVSRPGYATSCSPQREDSSGDLSSISTYFRCVFLSEQNCAFNFINGVTLLFGPTLTIQAFTQFSTGTRLGEFQAVKTVFLVTWSPGPCPAWRGRSQPGARPTADLHAGAAARRILCCFPRSLTGRQRLCVCSSGNAEVCCSVTDF